jgi:predicted dehydrogenase
MPFRMASAIGPQPTSLETKLMPTQRLKVGVSGCGAVTALYHATALQILEKEGVLRLTALFDPDAAALAQIGAMLPDAKAASSFDDLLSEPLDLVIVASPPAHHVEQVTAALRAGFAVFCEKPLATRLADAEALVALAKQTGQILAVGMVRRYFPATRMLRELIRSGVIGEVREFRSFEGGPFDWPVRTPSYFSRNLSGGGVLMDVGVHALDLLGWWFGPCTNLSYEDDAMGGVEAECRLALTYGEVAGELRLSRIWHRPNRYEIIGTRGRLGWTVNEAERLDIQLPGSAYRLNAAIREGAHPASNFYQSVLDQLRAVATAVAGGPTEIVQGEDILPVLALIERCYRERKLLRMDWLDPDEQRAAERLAGVPA